MHEILPRDVVFEEYNDLILHGRGRSAVADAPSAPGLRRTALGDWGGPRRRGVHNEPSRRNPVAKKAPAARLARVFHFVVDKRVLSGQAPPTTSANPRL